MATMTLVPSYLAQYRYPDQENSNGLTDKTYLLSAEYRYFIFKNSPSEDIINIQVPGAKMNNLFVSKTADKTILTAI